MPVVSSPNKTITNALIQTFQNSIDPVKMYDCLSKMDDDLNNTYQTLFGGPLPNVDGFNINALDPTKLSDRNKGLIPDDVISPLIARLNLDNIWSAGQSIYDDAPYFRIGVGHKADPLDPNDTESTPLSFFTLGTYDLESFYIGQNFTWLVHDFARDNPSNNALVIEFFSGQLQFQWWAPAESPLYASPHKAKTWNFNGRDIGHISFDGSTRLNIIGLNIPDDLVYLAQNAGSMSNDYRGHMIIPNLLDTQRPVIDGSAPNRLDGLIMIDKVNKQFCYYTNGQRFKLTGTSF